jgi:thiamine-phosphate pyrophosphorylase
MLLPRLYPILDAACFPAAAAMFAAAEELAAAGCTLLQYRDKSGSARHMLDEARELRARIRPNVILIMNDRADLCLAAGFDGLHVGQDDLSPEAARSIIGSTRWLGVSTHNPEQLSEADLTSANYLAIGPVFATAARPIPIRLWDSKASAGRGN